MKGPRPELLSPAGDHDCLRAAVSQGADAVYFGLDGFNARMRAGNFRREELPEVVGFCHQHGVKAYVTMNVLIFTDELEAAVDQLAWLDACGVDAVIIQDVGLARAARELFPGLRVHASTQMSITSPEGVEFARRLGASQIVLARELSLRELAKFDRSVPLEVFVHGALCVAYSGQCLTSESLGQRSANRGECAQACRMPYELVVDGQQQDLGDKRYLVSPQDLAGLREIPELMRLGIRSFKIEGRLKSPEYVAAVTAVYRKAIDAAWEDQSDAVTDEDWYALEMTFSRGLYSGWLHGVNHQELVGARFGKKRGAYCGRLSASGRDWFELAEALVPIKPGDGVVFDTGGDTEKEFGGRIFRMEGSRYYLGREKSGQLDLPIGCRVWKTSDPALEKQLRRSWQGRITPPADRKRPLEIVVTGKEHGPLCLTFRSGEVALNLQSTMPLQSALKRPLTEDVLQDHFGRLDSTPFSLTHLEAKLDGPLILPWSELSRLRREGVRLLLEKSGRPAPSGISLPSLMPQTGTGAPQPEVELSVLCRTMEQLETACRGGVGLLYVDFEDIRRYDEAVERTRALAPQARIFLATPRIQKAGEEGFFKRMEAQGGDGWLIRNVGALAYGQSHGIPMRGDFSLNVSNPLSASCYREEGLEALTISYDLNADQVRDLLAQAPPDWFELTLHQHMPMFHMEHCVFAAFLSTGTDFTNCGRPCEKHRVALRDRVGMLHPLKADVGCRNTLFNASPQSGAEYLEGFLLAGLRRFRIEWLEESADEAGKILTAYQELLAGGGETAWRRLRIKSQLGVTRGTLESV